MSDSLYYVRSCVRIEYIKERKCPRIRKVDDVRGYISDQEERSAINYLEAALHGIFLSYSCFAHNANISYIFIFLLLHL